MKEVSLARKDPIKIGDIFFTEANAIDCWQTYMNDCGDLDQFLQVKNYYGFFHSSIIDSLEESGELDDTTEPFLFAVKYLGNSVYEEMTTGEKMICSSGNLRHEDDPRPVDSIVDKANIMVIYEEYVSEEELENNSDLDPDNFKITPEMYIRHKNEYLNSVNYFKRLSSEYPLTFENADMYYVDDESKQEYLKNSNELRRKIIKRMKEIAINERQEIYKMLDEEVKNISPDTLTSEDLEMAYLENDLYDFEKGKSK